MGLLSVVGGNRALDAETGTSVRPRQPAGRISAFQSGLGVDQRKFRNPADALTDYPPFTALSAPAAVQAGPADVAATKKAAIHSPSSSANPLFPQIPDKQRSLRARSLLLGGRHGASAHAGFRGRTSPERADTDGLAPSGAGWRSPLGTERSLRAPVCGTSEWCYTGADPTRGGSPGCLNLRFRRKTVYKSGSTGKTGLSSTPMHGAGNC